MRRRPILYVTAVGTLVFSVLAIILGLRGIIVSLDGSPFRAWASFGAAACGLICLGFHIRLRRSQRNNSGSSQRGRKH